MDDKRTAWERLQLIHTKGRPTIKDYIPQIFTDWYEMHGDRLFGDDRAIITESDKVVKTLKSITSQLDSIYKKDSKNRNKKKKKEILEE